MMTREEAKLGLTEDQAKMFDIIIDALEKQPKLVVSFGRIATGKTFLLERVENYIRGGNFNKASQ